MNMLMALLTQLANLGRKGLNFSRAVGIAGGFLMRALGWHPRWSQLNLLLVRQLFFVGVLSLVLIIVAGIFIGMVVALQGFDTLERFGAEQALGQLLALSVIRELGPVVSALLFAGRAGTALTAEIGLMRSTQQLNSMEMMAVDPIRRIVAPRLWAGFISLPLLNLIFCCVAVLGGYWVAVQWLGVDGGSFWGNMQAVVSFREDIVDSIIKSVVFGFSISWIAVYQGFYTKPTARGIGQATTRTVVYSSLAVLGLDFFMTALMLRSW